MKIVKAFGVFFLPFFVLAQSKNLAPNPGFENGTNSWVTRTAVIDKTTKHSGNASLKYTNKNAGQYQVIVTHVNVKGGETFKFSAWVKGENITRKDYGKKGAGIYLHAYDQKGKSLGGSNPPTPSGTFNWTQTEGVFVVPKSATKLAVSLYITQGNTGTAWFDDVVVEPYDLSELSSSDLSLGETAVSAITEYAATNALSNATRESLRKAAVSGLKTQIAKEAPVFDKEGFLLKEGKRFFPFGVYLGKADKQGIWKNPDIHLNLIKEAGFNTVLSYTYGDSPNAAEYLDRLANHGLNGLYSLSYFYDGSVNFTPRNNQTASHKIAELVSSLKDKPALLGWYAGDEIEMSHILAAKQNYNLIKSIDSNHPVVQITNRPELLPYLAQMADVIGTDPYPIGKKSSVPDIKAVGNSANSVAKVVQSGSKKGMWQVVQVFNKVGFQGKVDDSWADPTYDQMQNMLFQSVISGAKGILLYAYHQLWWGNDSKGKGGFSEAIYQRRWADIARLSEHFNLIIPIILENKVVPVRGLDAGGHNIVYKAWEYNGTVHLMVANLENKKVTITIPDKEPLILPAQGSAFVKL